MAVRSSLGRAAAGVVIAVAVASAAPDPTTLSAAWLVDLPPPPAGATPRRIGKPGKPAPSRRASEDYPDLCGDFAVDAGGTVYIADDDVNAGTSEIAIEPATGSATELVAVPALPADNREELFGMAVDATSVYVISDLRNFDASRVAYAVRAVAKTGGPARVVMRGDLDEDGLATALAADDQALYLLRTGADGDGRFFGSIARLPKAGGAATTIVRGLRGFWPFAIADRDLYYQRVDHDDLGGDLVRVPKIGGGAPTVVTRGVGRIGKLAVAGGYVVAGEVDPAGNIALWRVPRSGGAREPIAHFDGLPAGFAVDGDIVYWQVLGAEPSTPSHLFARAIGKRALGAPRDLGLTLPRSAYWQVHGGVLYVSGRAGIERTPIPPR